MFRISEVVLESQVAVAELAGSTHCVIIIADIHT